MQKGATDLFKNLAAMYQNTRRHILPSPPPKNCVFLTLTAMKTSYPVY